MKLSLIAISLFGCCIFNVATFAQGTETSSSDDVSSYFDDDKVSSAKNVLQINGLTILRGDVPITYERVLTRRFSLEAGVGILLPFYIPELTEKMLPMDIEITAPNKGYSVYFKPKFYVSSIAPEGYYFAPYYRARRYFYEESKIRVNDFAVGMGFQYIIGKRMILSYFTGMGFRSKKLMNETPVENEDDSVLNVNLVLPLDLKFGFVF